MIHLPSKPWEAKPSIMLVEHLEGGVGEEDLPDGPLLRQNTR